MASRKPPTADEPTADETGTAESAASQPEATDSASPASTPVPNSYPASSNRFFDWMRELGIQRQPGWLGGVASGIGFRLEVDPIIVRGIIVVIAVLGGPALLLYAAAWLLLPDTDNRIHAEELSRGRFSPALTGIGIIALLSLLPLNQGLWFAGAAYWGDLSLGASFGRVLWTAFLLAAVVALIIWVARRANGSSPTAVPATTDDRPDTVPMPIVPAEQLADAPPRPPPAPARDAPADELQAWKEQQALWKQQHAEWQAQRTASERELRHQRAVEAHQRAMAASASRVEARRVRQLANPKLNAATIAVTLGLAIITGAITALLTSGNPDLSGHDVTAALAVGTIVLGLAIATAGALRQRSGILSFFALLAILATLASAVLPSDRVILLPMSQGVGPGGYAQPVGELSVYVHRNYPPHGTDIWQGAGNITVSVENGAAARVVIVSRTGHVTLYNYTDTGKSRQVAVDQLRSDGDWRSTVTVGDGSKEPAIIRIWQGSGNISISDENRPQPTIEEIQP